MNYEHKGYEGHKEYASKGMAGAGLGLGIAGTALGLGLLGGWGPFGRGQGYGHDGGHHGGGHHGGRGDCVDRFELSQSEKIARLESEKAMLEAARYADSRFAEQCCRISKIETNIARSEQAGLDAIYAVRQEFREVNARLNAITKEIVPASAICPPVQLRCTCGCVPTGTVTCPPPDSAIANPMQVTQ
jgi:hypothetical protein